jgi:C-terminal processing protease CtpA/Prc
LKLFAAAAIAAIFCLSACGGGGGGGSGPAVTPPSGGGGPPATTGPVWTQGVYATASTFKNRCAVVRTGVDIEGNGFPDVAGSTLEEKFWLRSWTNETYLWNTEVPDLNPALYGSAIEYFNLLKTSAITPSGKPKDDFHFSQPTTEYLEQRNSVPTASYGASFAVLSATPPRLVRVEYTEPGSPAAEIVSGTPALRRGTRILSVDGVDLVNGGSSQAQLDTLNNGLFPATAGESHTFVVQDPGAATTRTVTLRSVNLATRPVNRVSILDTPTGRVGYVLLTTFSPFSTEIELYDAFTSFNGQNVTDVVLDLRYNGGGLLAVASQLGYMVAGPARTNGQTFELLRFNAAAGSFNPVTGQFNGPVPFYNEGLGFSLTSGIPLPTLNLGRVFVLTTGATCSASEAVVNGLRGIDVEVILIGDTTCGKPFGFYPTDNCGTTYYTIQFQGVNDKGFGDYADGFVPNNSSAAFGVRAPGCAAQDDYNNELGDAAEGLLAAALQYRADGTCPTATFSVAAAARRQVGGGLAIQTSGLTPLQQAISNNRDIRMPGGRTSVR